MRKVCVNCHGPSHTEATMKTLDNSVALYNLYWDGAVKMKEELKAKGLWRDGYQELKDRRPQYGNELRAALIGLHSLMGCDG